MPVARAATVDAVVLGGGVCGLWIAARLRASGRSAVVIEANALGAGQTICSQGIIHGGVKYSLGGDVTDATRAIAAMPAVWGACLAGERNASIDLRGVTALSSHYYLWTSRGIGARLAGLAASATIRANVERAPDADRPPGLAGAGDGVDVYRVAEPVLDPASLVRTLWEQAGLNGPGPAAIKSEPRAPIVLERVADGGWTVRLSAALTDAASQGRDLEIGATCVVLAAGAGNEELIRAAERAGVERVSNVRMQRRPLHMVMARGELPALYAHWVAGAVSTPRATVTSQRDSSGRMVWYIGGAVAEEGVMRSREEQIDVARAELRRGAPWIGWDGVEWSTLRIDRAEAATGGGRRPEGPFVHADGGVITCWPTKMAFAPAVAAEVVSVVTGAGEAGRGADMSGLAGLLAPPIAALPWEEVGVAWC